MASDVIRNSALFAAITISATLLIAQYGASVHGESTSSESNGVSVDLVRETARGADTSSGKLCLVISSNRSSATDGHVPGDEKNEPPAEPADPNVENGNDTPSFNGEPLRDRFLWILDCSVSMRISDSSDSVEDWEGNVVTSPSRIDLLKIECIKTLSTLTPDQEFDILLLAGNENPEAKSHPPQTKAWKNHFVSADSSTLDEALQFIKDIQVWPGTPTYTALQRACSEWGSEIDQIFLISDGAPTRFDVPGVDDGPMQSEAAGKVIIQEFATWFAPLQAYGCELHCLLIGNNPKAHGFLQNLASAFNAKFAHIE